MPGFKVIDTQFDWLVFICSNKLLRPVTATSIIMNVNEYSLTYLQTVL